MAFTLIPQSWLDVGRATKKELFQAIKDSLDNHESRVNLLEQGFNKIEIFSFEVIGYINHYTSLELTGIGTWRAFADCTIIDAKLMLLNSASCPTTSSSAGTLSIQLEKSSDNGVTWTPILVQRPSIVDGHFQTGEQSGIFTFTPSGEIILSGELLRVNVYSKKDSQGSFLINVVAEVS